MKKLLVEFIGTFFLTLTVATAAVLGTGTPYAPFAIGSVLMVMIYAGGHVSGAHYNPAVSLAVYLRGRSSLQDLISYIVVQLLAGVAAVFVAKALVPGQGVDPLALKSTPTLISELLFTFALAWVVLSTATAKATSGNSNYGLAIGFTVLVGAITVGSISGGAFNPAVSTMLLVIGKLRIGDCWLHFLPQVLGAVVAAYAFKTTHPEDR
ncbi:aquaporin [Luteolibacter ambystomatis]|uniref:Aquaporin n=1 Tax=Luteolibacter ambystomatis TaxID=2824561 RepID=A0A975J107_9BACT|nr:aquaporin [Luteolibacter ambystomatis]QUE51994.1 aquaporin [Luteolibacter ambystomatis]